MTDRGPEELSEEELRAGQHDRWRRARPAHGLSWGPEVTGDAFVSKAASYGVYGEGKTVLEVGGGWGRLLEACLRQGLAFEKYVAVDISERNVRHLREKFPQDSVRIVHGAIEEVSLGDRFDSVLSSLTFKHFYPTFLGALEAIEPHLEPGAVIVFDLIEQMVEGPRNYFQGDTYVRRYTRAEVEELISQASLELVTLDEVVHLPETSRLLVVARK